MDQEILIPGPRNLHPKFLEDHALGLPILGTRDTVRNSSGPWCRGSYGTPFAPGNLIVTAAGNLDHEAPRRTGRQTFRTREARRQTVCTSPRPRLISRINLRNKKSLEQVQICIGVPSYPIAHERRYASYILNTLLGGGMSSRLFQNIRERQGLAYSIYSDLNPYRDTGAMSVYAGTSRESAIKVVECVIEEFRGLKHMPVPEKSCAAPRTSSKAA